MGGCCTKRKDNEQINSPPLKNTEIDKLKYKIQKYEKKKENYNILSFVNGTSGVILIIFIVASGPAVPVPVLVSTGVIFTSFFIFHTEKKNYEYKLKLYYDELNSRQKKV